MLDGTFKTSLDRAWAIAARGPVRLGMSPCQVTWSGLGLMAVVCLAYWLLPNDAVFGVGVAAVAAFDSLDGAVARLTGRCTAYGGYLDAMADRCQEMMVLAAVAAVHDCWPQAFLALGGSMLVSYAKARTAVERPIDNTAWPDLMERLERVIFLCATLLAAPLVPWQGFVPAMLLLLGILTLVTAAQRFRRAREMLR